MKAYTKFIQALEVACKDKGLHRNHETTAVQAAVSLLLNARDEQRTLERFVEEFEVNPAYAFKHWGERAEKAAAYLDLVARAVGAVDEVDFHAFFPVLKKVVADAHKQILNDWINVNATRSATAKFVNDYLGYTDAK